jgi:hypothetical protein
MIKWVLIATGLFLLVFFVIWQMDATKTSYVNGLAPYEGIAGHEYILERDCYIFKLKQHDTDYPLLGDHEAVPALPSPVSDANIGADLPSVRILDLARIGDHFRVVSVRRDQSRSATTITFEILFRDEAQRKYPRLDAFWIMDHSPEASGRAPRFQPDYAVERATE